jgi:VCBS repeat-containing protein
MKRALLGAAVLTAALLLVAGAGATTPPQATSVTATGAFSNAVVSPTNPGPFQLCGGPGQPTCASIGFPAPPSVQVRWGNPGSSSGPSGLGFGSSAPASVGLSQNFVVGSLSHFNWPVFGALTSVDLTVKLDAQTADGPIHFTLPFTLGIDETPNGTAPADCNPAYQPILTLCPDAIKLPSGGATFDSHTLNTHTYTLTVVGFTTSPTDLSHPASLLVTQEGQVTQGYLVVNLSRSNAAPVAQDDTATADSGGSSGPIAVLANDSDADGDAFAPAIATAPAHGTATVNPDGTITYTADSNFAGVDHFTYTDSDGIDTSAPADVAVTVTDATGPTITVPSGGAGGEATGPDGAAVTYDVSGSDNVDGSVAVDCVPPSGSTFPVGTTTVHCTATDAAGNTT